MDFKMEGFMKISREMNLRNFEAWSGAKDTLNKLIELDKCEELEAVLEDIYPDGISETQLNDILWFDDEWIFETLGIEEDEEEE